MIYPIAVYGSPVLRNGSGEIGKDYPGLKKLVADMFETMYAAEGVGLAAPQIGKNVRLFVVDATAGADDEPELADFKKVFVNPHIYRSSDDEELFNEGCLSLPGMHEDVMRPVSIRIRYFDEDFNEHDMEIGGYAARIVQHEYDHLDGKVFTDRVSPLRKTLIKNKLSSMARGRYKAFYKTKQTK